jgi:hypothetical protein
VKKSDNLLGRAYQVQGLSRPDQVSTPKCGCGRPATSRWDVWNGVAYVIHDPCETCATANRQRLDLLLADSPSYELLAARLLGPKS